MNDINYIYWPVDDIFFGEGVKHLTRHLSYPAGFDVFLFIRLDVYSLKDFFNFYSFSLPQNIIIIYEPNLSVLARYLLFRAQNVKKIFQSDHPLQDIINELNSIKNDNEKSKRLSFNHYQYKHFSHKDFEFFRALCMNNLENLDFTSQSNFYYRKKQLAKKLKVKRIEYLIYN